MTSPSIGQQLRRLVLEEQRQGRALDSRRLQAAIGDLCGAEHSDLVAPLRYLVLSRAFASAASQEPPLSDGRLLPRLQEELAEMYAPALCARLQPVLEELLGLPASRAGSAAAAASPGGDSVPWPRSTPPQDWSAAAGGGVSSQAGVPPSAAGGWREERSDIHRGTASTPGSARRHAGASHHDPGQAPRHADTRAGGWHPADLDGYGAATTSSAGTSSPRPADPGQHAWSTAGTAPAPAPSTTPRSGGGGSPLTLLLTFLCGMLLMALGGVALLLWQRNGTTLAPSTVPAPVIPAAPPSAPQPGPTAPAPPSPAAAGTPTEPPSSPAEPPAATGEAASAPSSDRAAVDRSVASIQQLYSALSSKDFDQARSLFGAAAADQFEPDFFRQFERVTVQNLETTGRSGSTVNLEGVVTFVYPDDSIQTETRTFSVDSSSEPARITASEFGRVIKAR